MGINAGLDEAIGSAGGSTTDVPWIAPVAINGRSFAINLRDFRYRTIPQVRPSSDSSNEPSEASLTTEGAWKRGQTSWQHGAGAVRYDEGENQDRERFGSSAGVDPWTEGELGLLHDTVIRYSSAATTGRLLVVGDYFVVVHGTSVRWTLDPSLAAGSITWVVATGLSGSTILGACHDGYNLYVGDGANVYKLTPPVGAAASAWHTYDAQGLWYANGRIIASKNEALVELSSDGTTTTAIKTHFITDMRWVDVIGTPGGIFIACARGTQGEIYHLDTDTSTGGLTKPVIAAPLPPGGEVPQALAFTGGLVVIGTNKGVRVALIADDELHYGIVVPVAGGVSRFAVAEDFAWGTHTNVTSSTTGLVRVGLGELVDQTTLQPAWCEDLVVAGQGTVLDVASFAGKRYLLVSGLGLYGEDTSYVASGTMTTPWISYGTIVSKALVNANIGHVPMPAGASITVAGETDRGTFTFGQSYQESSIEPPGPWSVEQPVSRRVRLSFTLTRGTDPLERARMTYWVLRAFPADDNVDELIVPVILAKAVQSPHDEGVEITGSPAADLAWIKQIEHDKATATVKVAGLTYNCRLAESAFQPTGYSEDAELQGVLMCRFLTVEV